MNSRILIFTHTYPFGKAEPFLESELKYMAGAFEQITLFPLEYGKEDEIRQVPEKIEILEPIFKNLKNKRELFSKGILNTSPVSGLIKMGLKSGGLASVKKMRIWVTHLLVIRRLLHEIRVKELINLFNQYDVLYFYWGVSWSQILPFLPGNISGRIIVRFHGSDLYEYANSGYIPWRKEQLERIDKVITISEAGRRYASAQYPSIKHKVLVSRIGTEDYGINPFSKSDILRIVSCSNLVPIKRVDLIIKTLSQIKIPVHWIHFGDGPEKDKIRKAVEQLPPNIKAELKGHVSHDELMKYYRSNPVDIFINVSSTEGVPVSVMEAMSFGIPVIATDVGGTSEIVTFETGVLIGSDFSPDELSSLIVNFTQRSDYGMKRLAAREVWDEMSNAEKIFPGFVAQLLSF